MKQFLMSVAVLALLTAPALAQSSVSTSTESTRTVNTPVPLEPAPTTSYDSSTVTHSDNGLGSTDSSTEKHVAPDGSTMTKHKVIEQETH